MNGELVLNSGAELIFSGSNKQDNQCSGNYNSLNHSGIQFRNKCINLFQRIAEEL